MNRNKIKNIISYILPSGRSKELIVNAKRQKGQALIEMMIVVPFLILLLLGIGYFGHAITVQQHLNMAARYMARQISMDSTSKSGYRMNGGYSFDKKDMKDLVVKALPGADEDRIIIKNPDVPAGLTPVGGILPIDRFTFLYAKKGVLNITIPITNLQAGVGTLFYGAQISYQLKELDNIAKAIGLRQGVTVSATSLMPAELPLRGNGYGLLELNPWISEIITEDVNNDHYQNLVD